MILIPAYQPSLVLVDLINNIKKKFSEKVSCASDKPKILIVNDGSTNQESKEVFQKLKVMGGVKVLQHPNNKGKGAAIKTGIEYAAKMNISFIVTADADGQHCANDIIKLLTCAKYPDNLILGVRKFNYNSPLRSRFGNAITKFIFRLLYKIDIKDTQTGLRKIPSSLFNDFLQISSNGYEFEFDSLIRSARMRKISQIPIKTIYELGNPTSHFRPFLDSAKIYYVLSRHIILAISISMLDYSLFTLGTTVLGLNTFLVIACSRGLALILYFFLAKEFVFRSLGNMKTEFFKFFLLVFLNTIILAPFIDFTSSTIGMDRTFAYIIGTFFLYTFNFIVQKVFVFSV